MKFEPPSSGAALRRLARWGVTLLLSWPVLASAQPAAAGPASKHWSCIEVAATTWPSSPASRRAFIGTLQQKRSACLDDPVFLALLGALLLEEGDAEQALIWLERSLMLDPDNLGTQADYALALAALGQPEALLQIAESLRHRSDLPKALRDRLFPAQARDPFALPLVRLGLPTRRDWGALGEVSVLTGYEGNLDRAPRLSELTLTLPDGPPIVLPVSSQPRAGAATQAAAVLQLAYAPQRATVLRSGFSLMARASPSQSATNWRQWQWAASAAHRLDTVRLQLEVGVAGFAGPLGEPYGLRRFAFSADQAVVDCSLRLTTEGERRIQDTTRSLDAEARAWLAGLQCPSLFGTPWSGSFALRRGKDMPSSAERPGGIQRTKAAGLRLAGPLGAGWRVDLAWRTSSAQDELGYSALLESNAARRLKLRHFSLELARPLFLASTSSLEAVLQWQRIGQGSNLQPFVYRADSAYTGLRWAW